jgi:hypothetical protein
MVGIGTSCSKTGSLQSQSGTDLSLIKESGLLEYALPSEHQIYTWEDMDQFYKISIEKYKTHADLDNFKHAAIMILVQNYQILENKTIQSNNILEYYCMELLSVKSASPKYMLMFLNRLKGTWSNSKLIDVAQTCYKNYLEYIKSNKVPFDPQRVSSDKEIQGYLDQLNAYGND